MTTRLTAADFPPGSALHAFFRWNEARLVRDRRYRLIRSGQLDPRTREALRASIGVADPAAHAGVFAGFERREQAEHRRVLVIKLGALGDFVQALGPMAAIRAYHRAADLTLLTTPPFADLAQATGLFDRVTVAARSRAPGGLWALRQSLILGAYDRVYDLQTSDRSRFYRRLIWPRTPEWSGHDRWGSHPHANLDRDAMHTIDRQAEQLLMAGIHPTPPPTLPAIARPVDGVPEGRPLALLIPGSSPHRPEKRWPADAYGALARQLWARGFRPLIVGSDGERALAARIQAPCPEAIDLTGRTDLLDLVALARRAALTIGNDTGVTHLAAVGGHAVRVLFSESSDPSRCAPRGAGVAVLRSADLQDLSVDRVLQAIDRTSID